MKSIVFPSFPVFLGAWLPSVHIIFAYKRYKGSTLGFHGGNRIVLIKVYQGCIYTGSEIELRLERFVVRWTVGGWGRHSKKECFERYGIKEGPGIFENNVSFFGTEIV